MKKNFTAGERRAEDASTKLQQELTSAVRKVAALEQELQQLVDSPPEPAFVAETLQDRQHAQQLLEKAQLELAALEQKQAELQALQQVRHIPGRSLFSELNHTFLGLFNSLYTRVAS